MKEEVKEGDQSVVDMAQKADRSGEGFKNAVFDLADLKLDVKPYYPPGNILF